MRWIKDLLKWYDQYLCQHLWQHKKYHDEEWYECYNCGKQEEVDRGTYL